jgi:regulatory protein
MTLSVKPVGPAPTRAQLHEAALRHLARFSATEAGLVRVLDRRIDRWARIAHQQDVFDTTADATARAASRVVARALVEGGLVNDETFAAARARRLARAGRSRRSVAAHLAAKGIAAETIEAALPDPEQELQSALAYVRRRRIGPFRVIADEGARPRELAALARAGFSRDVAEQALRMERESAESLVLALKRG